MPPCPARRRKAGERTVSAETLEQFGPRPSTAADCQPDPASAWVYMVRCADGSLYSGWTNDLAHRLRAHKGGKAGAKYTHAKGAVKLTYAERCTDKSAALKREAALKKLPKPEKEALAAQWTAENTITLRDAAPEDAAAVAELYNWYVTHSTATFQYDLCTEEFQRENIAYVQQRAPFLVAVNAAGKLCGFACAHPWHSRTAYAWDVELTVYCAHDCVGQGVGGRLYKALLDGVGNALDFRLGRLRSQYDLKQDAQRLEYVKEAVEMLAQRSNPTEQEVYAGRLAEETNISKTAIMAQLADAVKKAGSKRRREQNRARLKEGEMDQIKVPYGAGRGALGMASAEQRLLAAMLREPGYIDKVSAQLRPEQFLQPQQKELYEAMLRCKEQGVEVSLATLRAFVSEEALNELSRLAAQYSDVNCTPEDIKLYLERIARGTPVASRAASMSTNDIEQYLQSMREQKQGTADAEDSV